MKSKIILKTPEEIFFIRRSCQILAYVLKELRQAAKAGISAADLDKLAREITYSFNAEPAFLNYQGYPAALCVSVNEEVVHALPSKKKILQEGDIVSLDYGVIWPGRKSADFIQLKNLNYRREKGFYSDAAITVEVGNVSPIKKKLVQVTKESLEGAIRVLKPGVRTGDIGFTIQSFVESFGFQVVRDLVGHGVGCQLHEDPEIPNWGMPRSGVIFKKNMVVAIEPMVSLKDKYVQLGLDGYAYLTVHRSPAAHFEKTILVTQNGCEVLTQWDK